MKTVCRVCMHHCGLEPGQRGRCGARKNEGGQIVCENYGKVTSLALDPIEKKPFRRFRPGSYILSVGSYGCNLRCPFCQNHEISMAFLRKDSVKDNSFGAASEEAQGRVGSIYVSPQMLAEKAFAYTKQAGHEGIENIGVAFTYNEPLVGWEYVRDAFISAVYKEKPPHPEITRTKCGRQQLKKPPAGIRPRFRAERHMYSCGMASQRYFAALRFFQTCRFYTHFHLRLRPVIGGRTGLPWIPVSEAQTKLSSSGGRCHREFLTFRSPASDERRRDGFIRVKYFHRRGFIFVHGLLYG